MEKLIGKLRNNWRCRYVEVYEIIDDLDHVRSVGTPYDGSEPIICVERRKDYRRVIDAFPNEVNYD